MDDAIITGSDEYQTRSGRRIMIVRPTGSRSFLGMLDDGKTIYAWDKTGESLSRDRGLDIIGRYPTGEIAS